MDYPNIIDLPLPLPAPRLLLEAFLVVSFLMHIFFVNLMVGGTIISFFAQIKSLRVQKYDKFAYFMANTITVNKSLAVVLGVGPLLTLNVLYTVYFYSANGLTGHAWISVIPLVFTAFLLSYIHKFCWYKMDNYRKLHIFILFIVMVIFLIVPLIFLSNINLMLFPNKWLEIKGFFSALFLSNVWPRYFHFLAASIALTGVYVVWLARRLKLEDALNDSGLEKSELIRLGYLIAFIPTLLQFIIGPIVFFTMPEVDGSNAWIVLNLLGAFVGLISLFFMLIELKSSEKSIGRKFWIVVFLLTITVLCMASGRHMYRESAIGIEKEVINGFSD